MKKVFCTLMVLLLIAATSAKAERFISYAFFFKPAKIYLLNQEHEIKDVDKFLYTCRYYTSTKEKKFLKLQEEYGELIQKYPNEAHLLDFFFGCVNVTSECPIADKTKGLELLLKAQPRLPAKEQAFASQNIAYCYLFGIGTEKNAEKALSYYENACSLGGDVNLETAFLYMTGVGTPVNEEKAFYYFQNNYYSNETRGDNCTYDKMLSLILMGKQELNKEAKAFYLDGLRNAYIYKNYAEAVSCFEKAAAQGLSNAMFEIAMLYKNEEMWKDMKKKECRELRDNWLERAASNGYFPAIFEQGCGKLNEWATFTWDVEKGRNDAYPYFVQLAENGYDPAIFRLSTTYNNKKYESTAVFGNVSSGKLSVLGSLGGGTEQAVDKRECFGDVYIKDKFLRTIQKAMHGVE